MPRIVLFLASLGLVVSLTTAASAQGGGRRGRDSITAFGRVPNFVNTPEYRLWASDPWAHQRLMIERQAEFQRRQQAEWARQNRATSRRRGRAETGPSPFESAESLIARDRARRSGRRPSS